VWDPLSFLNPTRIYEIKHKCNRTYGFGLTKLGKLSLEWLQTPKDGKNIHASLENRPFLPSVTQNSLSLNHDPIRCGEAALATESWYQVSLWIAGLEAGAPRASRGAAVSAAIQDPVSLRIAGPEAGASRVC
jgi:hypothetical protein